MAVSAPTRAGARAPRRPIADSTLTLRALNRATLARQMLLAREKTTPPRVIERLVSLQAQWPRPPFVGIWSRIQGFERQDLVRLILTRKVARATTMRGTLHLMTTKDYLGLRAALQPALTHGGLSLLRDRAKDVQLEPLLKLARDFFGERPHTFEDLRDVLEKRHPRGDIRAMAYLVRLGIPLVQVPDAEATWCYAATSSFALAESWLGASLAKDAGAETLVLRYLAAFGPATASDMQTWSGLPPAAAREAFHRLAPRLVVLRGERGRELFDLPKAPRPSEDAEAPARFLPEFDNLLLSHADRRRFVADAHRPAVYSKNLLVSPTFLADGFVAGTWKVERKKDVAALLVQPFGALAKGVRDALEEEGEKLARFLEPDAETFAVRVLARR